MTSLASFDPSLVRRGLDLLLEHYPFHDVLDVDWQWTDRWVRVVLGQPSEEGEAWARIQFAISSSTGNVYRWPWGKAVEDDPFLVVTPL